MIQWLKRKKPPKDSEKFDIRDQTAHFIQSLAQTLKLKTNPFEQDHALILPQEEQTPNQVVTLGNVFGRIKRPPSEDTPPIVDTPQPKPRKTPKPRRPHRAGLPANFWTEIIHYPFPLSSNDYYDEGPLGKQIRQDIKFYAAQAKRSRRR